MLTPQQEAARKSGIGASEIADVLGIGFKTPYELWLEKTGRVEHEDISDKDYVVMGNLLEPVIATRYEQLRGVKLRRVNQTQYHKDYSFLLCHIDRKVEGEDKCVEIKTGNPFDKRWGEDGSDDLPLKYIAQLQYQMGITGYDSGDLIAFLTTQDIKIYPFVRDEPLIEMMFAKAKHFWEFHVLQDIPPEATTRGDLTLMFPNQLDNFIDANDEILGKIDGLDHIKEKIKESEGIKKELEFDIIKFIADNTGIKHEEEPLISYKANKNGVRSLRSMKRK